MEGCVEEGVEAEHAAEADEPRNLWGEPADGGNGERCEESVEGPVAGEVGDVIDGVGVAAEQGGRRKDVDEPEEGYQAEDMQEGLQEDDAGSGHRVSLVERVVLYGQADGMARGCFGW